jgi:hypothetical protein
MLDIPPPIVEAAINEGIEAGRLVERPRLDSTVLVYLAALYACEEQLAQNLALQNKSLQLSGINSAYGNMGDVWRNILATYNPAYALSGYGTATSGANSALNTGANLAQTFGQQVQQPKTADMQGGSIWKNLLGSTIGAGVSFLTGGLSNLATGDGSFLSGGGAAIKP